MNDEKFFGKRLLTRITQEGRLELIIKREPVAPPESGEVLIRVEAAPINPSDLGLLLGPADLATLRVAEPGRVTSAELPPSSMASIAGRVGQALPAGNEGAGVVIAAGAGCEDLIGRTVAVLGRTMYAQYHVAKGKDCLVLPHGVRPAQAASCFINPLTALSMLETMRREGHRALVHTAAASNLGQILNRVCQADGVDLVNIVRRDEQASLLRSQDARHVCVSSAPDFHDRLRDAVEVTGATLLFDAIGGGRMISDILSAMEAAAARHDVGFRPYGSPVRKQAYIYGSLDPRPTEIERSFGLAWAVGGWLLTPFLQSIGEEAVAAMRQRVAAELTSTFASEHAAELSLEEAIAPDSIRSYARLGTGAKFLINANKQVETTADRGAFA